MTPLKSCRSSSKVILISPPWPLYSRPSIQLGALQAFVRASHPSIKVDAYHLYLKVAEHVGYKIYHAVSQRTWPAECVYGALLYPNRKPALKKLFQREAKGEKDLRAVDFEALVSKVEDITEALIAGVNWEGYRLAGFSLCLCQLTSTLYFIRRIKAAHPDLPVVVGGSLFAGELAKGFMQTFKEVDFFINGEGELPLARLVESLDALEACRESPPDPGIITQKTALQGSPPSTSQLPSLEDLPCPDYDDYFRLLKTVKPDQTFFPTLSMEISRGCWWSSRPSPFTRKGCAFCNLNLQWKGYRTKNAAQVVSELDALTAKHKILSVAFMDNLLPLKASVDVFPAISGLKKDLTLFGEIRATTPRRILKKMKAAGIREVQIGIEALSTDLLAKLHKGTTAIQNLQIMRDCEELGIANISNLILQFPGSRPEDVDATLRAIAFAQPFRPLRPVTFWLGYGSPAWRLREKYGVKAVGNHPYYRVLFPETIFQNLSFMIQTYRNDRGYQKKLWRPVKEKTKAWEKAYKDLHASAYASPILTFRDGRDFMIIRQRMQGKAPQTHRLLGTSRLIYLYCCKNRALKGIVARFPKTGAEKILPFLKMMVDKKLMFEEKGRYLSLAVPASSRDT